MEKGVDFMTKLTLQEKITADVDDDIFALKQRIKLKYKLNDEKAAAYTNYSLRVLMLGFVEEWMKR